jgi:hypothetical protein
METTHQEYYTRRNVAKRNVMKQLELVTKIAFYEWYEIEREIESSKTNHLFSVQYPRLNFSAQAGIIGLRGHNTKYHAKIKNQCKIDISTKAYMFKDDEIEFYIFFKVVGDLRKAFKVAYELKTISDEFCQYQIKVLGIDMGLGGGSIDRDNLTITIMNMFFNGMKTEKIEELSENIRKIFLFDFIKYQEKLSILFESDEKYI